MILKRLFMENSGMIFVDVAHLWNEKNDLELVLADTEQLLRNTLGYTAIVTGKQK